MANVFTTDAYTIAKVIDGSRKLKTFSKLDPSKLGNLSSARTTEQKNTVQTFANAMSAVIAGTDANIQDELVDGETYKYRLTRTMPITVDES